jgi:hypothetical protein
VLKRKFCVDEAACRRGEGGEAPTHPPTHSTHPPTHTPTHPTSFDKNRLMFPGTRTSAFRGGGPGGREGERVCVRGVLLTNQEVGGESRTEGDEAENRFEVPVLNQWCPLISILQSCGTPALTVSERETFIHNQQVTEVCKYNALSGDAGRSGPSIWQQASLLRSATPSLEVPRACGASVPSAHLWRRNFPGRGDGTRISVSITTSEALQGHCLVIQINKAHTLSLYLSDHQQPGSATDALTLLDHGLAPSYILDLVSEKMPPATSVFVVRIAHVL